MAHPRAVTGKGCVICDGPCTEPMAITVQPDYPFLDRETIAAMQPVEPTPPPPEPKRSKRLAETTARKPGENTSRQPSENR